MGVQRVKMPPAPKAPKAPSGLMAEGANALGSALGIETTHQRAVKAHAGAMKRWRETVKDFRHQEALAWDQLAARSALAPLAQRTQKAASAVAQSLPTPLSIGRRVQVPR